MVAERQKAPKMAAQHYEVIPRWDGHSSSLDAYEERVKLYIMSTKKDEKSFCGPRLLSRFEPESDAFRIVPEKLTDEQFTAEDGSGGKVIIIAPAQSSVQRACKKQCVAFYNS